MFPISSTSLTASAAVNQSTAVAPVDSSTVTYAGSATDAPAPASVAIELSPVAQFMLAVSQSQQQISDLQAQQQAALLQANQAQTAAAGDVAAREAALRAIALTDATQNVVNAFNRLPSVDYNQAQPQNTSLLNHLVGSLNQPFSATSTASTNTGTNTGSGATALQPTAAQSLAKIGVTLQAPLLSDATGGLSLDNEVLRAAFSANNQATAGTLQNTLNTFGQLATRFAEQLSAAGSASVAALGGNQQVALTPSDMAANARLDLARAALGQAIQSPQLNPVADGPAAQPLAAQAAAPATAQATAQTTAPATATAATQQTPPTTAQATAETSPQATAQTTAPPPVANSAPASTPNITTAQNANAAPQAVAVAVDQQGVAAPQAVAVNVAQNNAAAAPQAVAVAVEQQSDGAAPSAVATTQTNANAQQQTGLAAQQNADAAQQADVAQNAAARATALQIDPLRANPMLASAIAAYNLGGVAVSGDRDHAAKSAVEAIPRVTAVDATARIGGIGGRA